MRSKKTPWFDATRQYPVRPGWYEYFDWHYKSPVMRYWGAVAWWSNGGWAMPGGLSVDSYPGDKWRGLLKEAKK